MVNQVEEPILHNEDDPEDAESTSVGLNVSIKHDPSPPAPAVIPNMPRSMSKFQILKNLYVMSIAQFLFFLGFVALTNLQSTLNSNEGGIESQATIYSASIISALLLPKLLIKSIGCKKTLVLAIIGSIPYVAANFYPSVDTLIPTAVLFGLSAGPLTASQEVYTNEMARRYYKHSQLESYESVVARFFGIFYFFSCNTQIWGNFISYYVLRPSVEPILNNSLEEYCGVEYFSPDYNETNGTNLNLDDSTEEKRFLLVGIYVSFGVLSVLLMIFFMDPLENDVKKNCSTKTQCQLVMSRLVAAVKHTMNTDQMLLVPISIFCGIEISFYASEFTQAFIACSWGVYHVGFVSICFGVCGALMSLLVGPLVKFISQMYVFLLAAALNVTVYVLLFVWKPSPEFPVFYFVFSGIWGMTDAIWWSQVAALYGLMFPNDREAAFSNFMFWGFMGYLMSYSYANYLSVAVKIYIMLIFLIVGITLYLIGQIKIKFYSPRRGYIVIS